MRIIKDDRRLPKVYLQVIAAVGWVCVLYLAWVIGEDSWRRTLFSFQVISGALPDVGSFNQRYVNHPWWTLAHTIPGVFFAFLGPVQFIGPIRRRVPVVHRISGRLVVVIGIAAGISAVFITFLLPIWGSPLNMVIPALAGAFMVFAFGNAYHHVRARRFTTHREWMIRGFTIGLAVAFFRVLLRDVLPWMGIENYTTRFTVCVQISWPIMLGVAELWIRATRGQSEATATAADLAPSESPA